MNKSEEKALYFKIGREEGISEPALEKIWLIGEILNQKGFASTLRDETTIRLAFRERRETMEALVVLEPDPDMLAFMMVQKILQEGGEEDEGISLQGRSRVSGSC